MIKWKETIFQRVEIGRVNNVGTEARQRYLIGSKAAAERHALLGGARLKEAPGREIFRRSYIEESVAAF